MRLPAYVSQGSWSCKNADGRSARRTAFRGRLLGKLNHNSGGYGIHVLENCIFYISVMYEFLHNQGHKQTPSTPLANVRYGPIADAFARIDSTTSTSCNEPQQPNRRRTSGLSLRCKDSSFRLREQDCYDDHNAVSDSGKHTNRLTERQTRTQQPDKEWIKRGDTPSKIVSESLTGAANTRRKIFSQERPHPREDAGSEEAEREAENQHHAVCDGELRVNDHRQQRAHGKQNEVGAASDPVGQVSAHQIANERTYDDHRQVAAGPQHRQFPLGAQERRQPGRDGVIPTLRSGREN